MMNVEVKYVPYGFKTEIEVDGYNIKESKGNYQKIIEKIDANIPIQTWIDKTSTDDNWNGLLEELVQSSGEVNISFKFIGREIDFKDFETIINSQNTDDKYCINWKHEYIFDDKEISKSIEEIVNKMQEDDFKNMMKDEHLSLSLFEDKYDKLNDSYKELKNKEFNIVFVGEFSSGKSTFINSIIGRKILPSRGGTCTSRVFKIKHKKDAKDEVLLRCYDENDKILVKEEGFTKDKDVLKRLKEICPDNDGFETVPPGIDRIEIEMNLESLYPNKDLQDQFKIVIIDTPGTDSASGNSAKNRKTHKDITLEAIHKNDDMVIYVCADRTGADSQEELLDLIEEESKDGGAGFNDRFLFVKNKCDTVRYDDDESLEETIAQYAKDLRSKKDGEDRKLPAPRIFPVTSLCALEIKKGEEDECLDFKRKIDNELKRKNYCLDECTSLSEPEKEELKKEYSDSEDREILLHTGVPSVEYAIKQYVEKYAFPKRAAKMIDTFGGILEYLNTALDDFKKALDEAECEKTEKNENIDDKKAEKSKAQQQESNHKKAHQMLANTLKSIGELDADEFQRRVVELQADADIKIDYSDLNLNKSIYAKEGEEKIKKSIDTVNDLIEELHKLIDEVAQKEKEIKNGAEISFKNALVILGEDMTEAEKSILDNLGEEAINEIKKLSKVDKYCKSTSKPNEDKYFQIFGFKIFVKPWRRYEKDSYTYKDYSKLKDEFDKLKGDVGEVWDEINNKIENLKGSHKIIEEWFEKVNEELKSYIGQKESLENELFKLKNDKKQIEKKYNKYKGYQKTVETLYSEIEDII